MSYFTKLFTVIRNLGSPVRYGGIGYLGCAVLYTGSCCYQDSLKSLYQFRNIDNHENKCYCDKNNITSEWLACKHGAYYKFGDHFFSSIIWPFSLTADVIPGLVLLINRAPKKD